MQYSEGSIGRVFTLRLETGERVPDAIEEFARQKGIKSAFCALLGGIGGGDIVVGPRDDGSPVIDPILLPITGAHEAAAVGTIFSDESGAPVLHMHAALGREGRTHAGCIRPGLDVWLVGEVVILEILDSGMLRRTDPASGLALLAKE
ncbi:PPC domain-containing DNA-binding protein [Pseudodesulfovibrio sp.]|uniref:PPC domain-containing DNA-binding protein n=1 Tax=Pseudodesulfovibrio sp. TaxID=2035812 RepID=UPI00262A3618|nr:PPC domain-containing DNA-binding protein [Pseudodesulfovibrio sp.]MDD3312957.1 DNA-binding protein [Pseudodesulfovibrio sp.]